MQSPITILLIFNFLLLVHGVPSSFSETDCDECCNTLPFVDREDCKARCEIKFGSEEVSQSLKHCIESCLILVPVCQTQCRSACQYQFTKSKRKFSDTTRRYNKGKTVKL